MRLILLATAVIVIAVAEAFPRDFETVMVVDRGSSRTLVLSWHDVGFPEPIPIDDFEFVLAVGATQEMEVNSIIFDFTRGERWWVSIWWPELGAPGRGLDDSLLPAWVSEFGSTGHYVVGFDPPLQLRAGDTFKVDLTSRFDTAARIHLRGQRLQAQQGLVTH